MLKKNCLSETTRVFVNVDCSKTTPGQVTNHVDDLAICSSKAAWKHKWPLQGFGILKPLPPRCNLALPWHSDEAFIQNQCK